MTVNDIKSWWYNLTERDRQMATVGGIVLGVFLFYIVIWSPLSNVVVTYKTNIAAQHDTLTYLQSANTQIQRYQAQGIQIAATDRSNLLAMIEQSATDHKLSAFLKQVEQPQPNHIALTFEKAPFDQCMQWLQQLSTSTGVQIITLTADRLTPVGTANIKVVLG